MLQVELKKILLHQKGLPILLLSLCVYAILCIGNGSDSSYVIDRNEDIYLSYMDRWQGVITEKTAKEMEAEYYEVNRSNDGKKTAFMVIYNQYYYAKEDVERRYLMDERGWNTLLTHDGLNFVMLLCLLAFSVPVFCNEYQCGMDQIFRSCRNGRNRLACIKLLIMMAVAVFAATLFQLIQLTIVAISVGLDGASFPLQSLAFFEDSPYIITIGQAYAIVFLCRCIGAAWFALLIAMLSILFRRVVLTAFTGIACSVLPHLIGSNFIKYILPLPAGMLAGTGYLWGILTEPGYNENWELIDIVTFPGISPMQFGFLLVVFLLIIVLMFYISLRGYVGRRKTHISRSALSATMLLLLITSLTGCTSNGGDEVIHDFLADATQGENSTYCIELNMLENEIYATDKETGEVILLTRDPLHKQGLISSIYINESACYYSTQGNAGEGFEIYRVDLNSFSTQLYFSNTSDNASSLWGLYQHELTKDEILADIGSISSFAVDDGCIYYLRAERLYKVCRLSVHETVVVSDTGKMQTLIYQNGKVMYEE